MPRPKSKQELLDQSREEYDRLVTYLEMLTPEQKTVSGVVGEWSVKDVVAHLVEWGQMLMRWYVAGQSGEAVHAPAEGYTWQQIPALNQKIYEQYRDVPLDDVLGNFYATHSAMMEMIAGISNDDLFTPKVYQWTKSTTLGSYFVSATSSHYAWAYKAIRKGMKAK